MYHSHPEIRRARRWAEPAGRCVDAGSGRVGKPGNQLRPWDLVQPRGSRVSPANHRGGGWDFEPVTASTSVVRIASEPCGSDCGWRRVARVAGSRLQPYRMETCDTEEPDEGKLHVRIRGEAGGASPRLYPDRCGSISGRGQHRFQRESPPVVGAAACQYVPLVAPCPMPQSKRH
jgi:hypothetical protein